MNIKKYFNDKTFRFCLSFALPFFAIFTYFAFNHFNFLTVDLGQQYIDFLSFLKHNLFTSPGKLIFSWSNGLGESMLATDAYYLLSPVNLLLILFPDNLLPFAILLVICIKFGLSGLTSFYFWKTKFPQQKNYDLAASFAYSLSGYMVANYFNLMWLDTIILLPLLIMSIDKLITNEKNHLILITFLIWFTNFYTGFMALLFGLLYFISQIVLNSHFIDKKTTISNYLIRSFFASLAASFVIIPVIGELIRNPNHNAGDWAMTFQFTPWLELDKLLIDSYNYPEMQTGMPNIYFSIIFLFTCFAYFISKKITWKEKLTNGFLLTFLTFSLFFTPLVLIWHLGKFPVWYPGRFSFVLIFFCLNLGLHFLNTQDDLSLKQKAILVFLGISLIIFWICTRNQVSFINDTDLIISGLFVGFCLIFYFLIFRKTKYDSFIFAAVVYFEVVINLVLSLNKISFQNNQDYTTFQNNLREVTSYQNKIDPNNLYRTEKSFSRSDDDPYTASYNGVTTFNSVIDPDSLQFLNSLGYYHNSNSNSNQGSTLITDAILGVKYYIQPNFDSNKTKINHRMFFNNQIYRSDLNYYFLKKKFSQLYLLENYSCLPLVFLSNSTGINFQNNPMNNQIRLLQSITGNSQPVTQQEFWNKVNYHNIRQTKFSRLYEAKNNKQTASITYTLNYNPKFSYYLYVPEAINRNNALIKVNQQEYDLTQRDDQNRLINIQNEPEKLLNVKIILKNEPLDLTNFKVYGIDIPKFTSQIRKFKQKQPLIYQTNNFMISSNKFKLRQKTNLLSTIPYSHNWFIFDNGHLINCKKFENAFLMASLAQGIHRITFLYIPLSLIIGIIISFITLIVIKKYLY